MTFQPADVRYWGQNGHGPDIAGCPLLTQSGQLVSEVPCFGPLAPCNTGGRFSREARGPSTASALLAKRALKVASWSNASASV